MTLKGCSDFSIPEGSVGSFLLSSIRRYGDKLALVDTTDNQSVTFAEIHWQARKCASALNKLGLKRGDFVGVCAPSCIEFPALIVALFSCGATVTTVNPASTEEQMVQQFSVSQPRMVFVSNQALDIMKTVAREVTSIQRMFVIGESEEFTTVAALVASGDERDFPESVDVNPKEDVAFLLFSSGTTGKPKSIMLTHYALTATILIFGKMYGAEPNTVLYNDRPMFYAGGMYVLLMALSSGNTLIQEKEFDAERMLRAVEKYKVTLAVTVPPMLIALLQTQDADRHDTTSLNRFYCGGASVAEALIVDVAKKFNASIFQSYGMTEVGLIAYQSEARGPINSVGKIVPNTTAKVVEILNGNDMGPNERGEIVVKGPQNMKGYYKNPTATSETIDRNGWVHTGDIGHYDEEGYLYIAGRSKEAIKYKTFQVSPAEIESVLLKHPHIADVGVVGIPDQYAGEIPMAFVVKSNEALTEKEVIDFVEWELAEYMHLRGGVQFTSTIPKSVQGKIQRSELKRMAEAYLNSRGQQ